MTNEHEEFNERLRGVVLNAIDEWAFEQTGSLRHSAQDSDLPDLFLALSPIATRIFVNRKAQ